jgi:hypothetical protein
MSNYQAIIAKIDQVIEIPGADNIHIAKVLGECVIVSKTWQVGMLGVFFPAGTQLSVEYAAYNNLYRDKENNRDKEKAGFFDNNRRVRAQPFMKVKSEGFFADLNSLEFAGDVSTLKQGNTFEEFNGKKIATKFINEKTRQQASNKAGQPGKARKKISTPLFVEHTDTGQIRHNMHRIEPGDLISIQTKKHGTSVRYTHTKVYTELPKWKKFVNRFVPIFPEFVWDYVVGTRRVVLNTPTKEGFHGSEAYRFEWLEKLKPYMAKGMTIYGEIVGFANNRPIMQRHSTKDLKNKDLLKKYGETMTYRYGCLDDQNDFHIYRITLTTEDGTSIDFTQKQLVEWCNSRGFKPSHDLIVPFVYAGDSEALANLVETLTEREDVLCEDYHDASHISEGVIIRIDKGDTKPLFLKNKSYYFKVLEGIAQENEVDLEDAS